MNSKNSTSASGPGQRFLGLALSPISVETFIKRVAVWGQSRERRFITYINAACVNVYFRDPEYAEILRRTDLLYADGQAVVWAARRAGVDLAERVNAGDFFEDFCRACAERQISLFFLGSREGIAERAADELRRKTPGLRIVGTHHGYFSPEEEPRIVKAINAARPDLLIVGMGVSRQEKWWAKVGERLEAPVCWCVGALFEYKAGRRARAPVWMRRLGLEWLFRLILEPRRLWRRYLVGNLVFLYRVWRNQSPKSKKN